MSDPKDCLICVAGKSRGGVRAFALNQYPENQNSAIFLALIQTGNQKIQIDPRTGPTFGTIGSSARDQNRANELLGVEPRRAVRVRRAAGSSAGGQNLTNELLGVEPRRAVRVRRAAGSSAGGQNLTNELLGVDPRRAVRVRRAAGSSAGSQNLTNELLGADPRQAVRVRRAAGSSAGSQNLTNELLGADPRQAVRVRRAAGSSAGSQNLTNELLGADPLACPPKRGVSAVPRITFRANADARRLKVARARLAVAAQRQRQVGGVVR